MIHVEPHLTREQLQQRIGCEKRANIRDRLRAPGRRASLTLPLQNRHRV